jgi:hypothetical protein
VTRESHTVYSRIDLRIEGGRIGLVGGEVAEIVLVHGARAGASERDAVFYEHTS